MTDWRSDPRMRHAFLPALIFVVVSLAALAAAIALWRSGEERDRSSFQAEARVASIAVAESIESQIALLRGAAGLFAADEAVEARDFEAYIDQLDLVARYPGVRGIGYAARAVGVPARDALAARMRDTAASGYRVRPEGERPVYVPVVFVSPMDRRNRDLVGYDMYADPVRREAMLRAVRNGEPAATARVVQSHAGEKRTSPGFVVYLPVFQGGRIPVNAWSRDRMLAGFVFSPVRADALLGPVFADDEVRSIDVAVYDRQASPSNLLYATGDMSGDDARFYSETPIRVAGRQWVIATAARPQFSAGPQHEVAWWIGLLGLSAGLALALAAWAQGRAALAAERARADLRRLNETLESRVEERTSEVTAAYAGIKHEIELRQGAEEQVRQMQKMEAVGQLTGGIAHDFNNMLAIVIGSLDMAKRRIAEPDRLERLIDNAMQGATRAAALTQRLLAFSRRQPLRPETIDVNRLVVGMSELLRRTLGETIMLESKLGAGAWRAFVDAGQLENAIVNLAVNARDAMPGGGTLSIETANRALDEAYEAANPGIREGDYVLIAVTDTGEGMPPETLARAFDPFFTTKEVGKGTGLGLSQVFGFIRQSGGHVEIESNVGVGTSVRLYLPRQLDPDQLAPPEPAEAGPTHVPRGTTEEIILVVEDEFQVRLMTVEALRDLGYTVVHAESGDEALRKLRAYPGVRLLFTDVVMPAMNGRELAETALHVAPNLKLLFTTGYTRDAIEADGGVGAVEVMAKPFTFEQLATRVRAVLDAGGAPSERNDDGDDGNDGGDGGG